MNKYKVKFTDGRLGDKEIKAENIAHARTLAKQKYGYCVVKSQYTK